MPYPENQAGDQDAVDRELVPRAIICSDSRWRRPFPFSFLADHTVLIFSIVALLMLLVALAFVVVPLLRARAPGEPVSDAGSNVAIYNSQRRELDEELARGAISESEHRAAIGELSTRVVEEVPVQQTRSTSRPAAAGRPWWLIAVIAVVMPLGASLLYGTLGAPRAIEMLAMASGNSAVPTSKSGAKSGEEPPMSDKQILAMVDSLQQKMQQNPNDPRGWVLLARSQNALGRFAEATAAFERAVALMPNDAQLVADYADASVMAQEGRFDGKPYALIQRALKLEPNNIKALALAGTAELRMGNRAGSLVHWQKLRTLVPRDSADYREIESIIAEVKTTKLDASAALTSNVPATIMPPSVSNSAAQSDKAPIENPAKSGGKVTGKVVIAPNLVGKLASGDTLFVFARAKEGPRMPLAVMRVPAPTTGGFPMSFELNDAMAMAPGFKLSSFAEVVIEARISKSGNAQLQTGDLSGLTEPVKSGASGVTVTISKVAP